MEKILQGDTDNIYTPLGVTLTLVSLFFSADSRVDATDQNIFIIGIMVIGQRVKQGMFCGVIVICNMNLEKCSRISTFSETLSV